jgi:uncharacterized protein YdeI (YjbR/CyaY-like superfamily)
MNPKIDQYLIDGCGRCSLYKTPQCKVHSWIEELHLLRSLLLESELTEECKWSMPCYTYQGKNVLILAAFKNWVSINFFKGALLKDEQKLLVEPGENSQAGRYFKFTSIKEVKQYKKQIVAFIKEAIELEKTGKKVALKKPDQLVLPAELIAALNQDEQLNNAFNALTPGRKRSFVLHIESAKQEKTRITRVEKCIPIIISGKGFNEY